MVIKAIVIRRQGPGREDEIELVKAAGGKVYRDRTDHYYSVFTQGALPVAPGAQTIEVQGIPAGWVEV